MRLLPGLLLAVLLAAWSLRLLMRALVTLPALAPMPLASRRLAPWLRARAYTEDELLRADDADDAWVRRRRDGLETLASRLQDQYAQSSAWGRAIRDGFSDMRFTDASRVPFPFARVMREKFNLCSVVTASRGPHLQNLDGHWTIDVSGSYGLNVAGFDRYKEWIERGWDRVKDLGPVLGPLHPVVADNLDLLKRISRLDEVSFHLRGTEADMAAGRRRHGYAERPGHGRYVHRRSDR